MKIKNIKNNLNKIASGVKRNCIKIISSTALILTTGRPVYAMTPLTVPGMADVATSLQNIILAVGLGFVAAGAFGLMHGCHKVFQSIKEQNGESRTTSILEAVAGLGSIAIGAGAAVFKAYIIMPS